MNPVVELKSSETNKRKQFVAKLVGYKLVQWLMQIAVRLFVPRQRIGVALVCFDEDGRILMLNHVFHPNTRWGVPGGWLQKGESPAECALRELSEETGLSAELGPVVYVSHEPVPPHVGIAFSGQIKQGNQRLSSEILDAAWYRPNDLPGPLLPFVEASIRSAVANQSEKLITLS